MTLLFYPAKNNDTLNGLPFEPERASGGLVMVNPVYPVAVGDGVLAVCDSTAFQTMLKRRTPSQALDRQLAFEQSTTRDGRRRFPRGFEALITYDMLVGVDEAIEERRGKLVKVKRRGTEETAAEAVTQTLASAEHYHRERARVAGAVAYAAQGATLRQYLACVRALLDLATPRDWLALGGFCIIGMQRSLIPLFVAVCREVAPLLRRAGIRRVHILGVCVTDALAPAKAIFAAEGIVVSTDSSSIERNSINGGVWSTDHMPESPHGSPWRQVYAVEEKGVAYQTAALTLENISRFADWCATPAVSQAMRVTAVCRDGHDSFDWVTFDLPRPAPLDAVLAAAEEAGIDREDVLRLYTPDGCYDFADAFEAGEASFASWSILDRERPALWRHAPGRARPSAPARERLAAAPARLPRARAGHGQMDSPTPEVLAAAKETS